MLIIFYYIIFLTTALGFSIDLQIPRLDCEESTNRFYPYPKICNVYYECKGKEMVIKKCEFGLNFNPELGVCDRSRPNDCRLALTQVKKNKFCPPSYTGLVADPENCKKFIICLYGVFHYQTCNDGFVFNDFTGSCDQLSNVPRCLGNMEQNNLNGENINVIPLSRNHIDDEEDMTYDSTDIVDNHNYQKFLTRILSSTKKITTVEPTKSAPTPFPVTTSNNGELTYLQRMWIRH